MESIERICIVGSGYMGWQIALQCARYGFPVNLYDVSLEAIGKAQEAISSELDTFGTAQVSGDKKAILNRIKGIHDLSKAVNYVDLVIEAVPEQHELKKRVFNELDKLCQESTIFATNSSSIRISKIEDSTQRKDKVLNTHFYSFPWKSRIVELMGGTATSEETINTVKEFMHSIGMIPLLVRKESTGFIFNRVWRAVKRECLHLVDEGVASYEDVDRAWMCLYRTEAGPFGLMDRVGLDVVNDIEMVYYEESGDPRDAPPRLLQEKVKRGELGVKTGRGFYNYPKPAYKEPYWLEKKT